MEYSMIIMSVVSGLSALVGSIISAFVSKKLSDYRIQQLEQDTASLEKDIDDLKQLKIDIAEIKVQLNNISLNMKGV